MHHLKIKALLGVLDAGEVDYEKEFRLELSRNLLDDKAKGLIKEVYDGFGGKGAPVYLDRLKFDFKINRFLFLYDGAHHFNRYRLTSLKSSIYEEFTFNWLDSYKRLCRTYEKDCLKGGIQERVWSGPPLASRCFGDAEEPGDLSGNGSPGWKLNAYNDMQYDLISRLSGYKIIRLPMYENIMMSGSLKRLDQLLLTQPEEIHKSIVNWLKRKMV